MSGSHTPHVPGAASVANQPQTVAGLPLRILLAVDSFDDSDVAAITRAVDGWGDCRRVAQSAGAEYNAALRESDVVVGSSEPTALLDSSVRLHQLPSVGYDAYLNRGLEAKPGFTLCNGAGTMAIAVAEHCLALMLALTRHVGAHAQDALAQRWERRPEHSYAELFGATVCVLGLGSIGTEIARRCVAFGMRVIGVRRDAARGHAFASPVYSLAAVREAVRDAGHVVLTLPLSPETERMIDGPLLDAMPRGVRLYNVGRGALIDEDALAARLQSGHVAGAGLDVFTEEPLPPLSPLWRLDNVLITPHVAGQSVAIARRLAALTGDNLQRFRDGQSLPNVVLRGPTA